MSSDMKVTTRDENDNYVIEYVDYTDESMLSDIQRLVAADLSEPYSVFTYRYFLHTWPNLCICVYARSVNNVVSVVEKDVKDENNGSSHSNDNTVMDRVMIGTIVCKAEVERDDDAMVGYIAMLAVNQQYRKRGIGQKLISTVIERMVNMGCEEITLEAEATNKGALSLYERLGFSRDDKMTRYYLNGGDAYRLKFWVDVSKDETVGDDTNNDHDDAKEMVQQESSNEIRSNDKIINNGDIISDITVANTVIEKSTIIENHSAVETNLSKLNIVDSNIQT